MTGQKPQGSWPAFLWENVFSDGIAVQRTGGITERQAEHSPYLHKPFRKTRLACAITACALVLFLIGHGIAGSVYIRVHFEAVLHWMAWLGPVVAVIHILCCAVETVLMMTDKVNPPTSRKKQHMAKKWITGILLLGTLVVHILTHGIWSTVLLLAFVLWHSQVGAKSLVRDFRLPRSYIPPVRAAFAVVSAVLALLYIWGSGLI